MSEQSTYTYASATRNDFVMVDDPSGEVQLTPERVAELAGGAGTDGLIRVVRTAQCGERFEGFDGEAPEWFMDYRNADGSLAQMCGNGVRAFAAFLTDRGYVSEPDFAVMTRAGVRTVSMDPSETWRVTVGMGPALMDGTTRRVLVGESWLDGVDVSVGNPHTVVQLPEDISLEDLDLSEKPCLEPEPEEGTNIEFVRRLGERHVAMRVFERGVGETLSCGTGATAVAAATAAALGETSAKPWRVDVRGGELTIGWDARGEMTLTGAAELGDLPQTRES